MTNNSSNSNTFVPTDTTGIVHFVLGIVSSFSGLGCAAFLCFYYLTRMKTYNNTFFNIYSTLCKPSITRELIMVAKQTISFFIFLINVLFIMFAFLSSLRPYTPSINSYRFSNDIEYWITLNNNINHTLNYTGNPTLNRIFPSLSIEEKLAIYLSICQVLLLLYTILSPYILSAAFQMLYQHEKNILPEKIPKIPRTIIFYLYILLQKVIGWMIVKLFVFLLTFYIKDIILIFLIVPWTITLYNVNNLSVIGFIFYGLWNSILLFTTFTIQGFTRSLFLASEKLSKQKNGLAFVDTIKSLTEKMKKKNSYLWALFDLVCVTLQLLVLSFFFMTIYIVKMVFATPEVQALQFPPFLFWICREYNGKKYSFKEAFKLVFVYFSEDPENGKEVFYNSEYPPPLTCEWSSFCSAYTLSFVPAIPLVGPFLFLIGTMFNMSGFWYAPFWLFIRKSSIINQQENKETIIYTLPQIEKTDRMQNILWKLMLPIRENDILYFIDAKSDPGKIRLLMMIIVPLIGVAPVFIVNWRNGFDLISFVKNFIFTN